MTSEIEDAVARVSAFAGYEYLGRVYSGTYGGHKIDRLRNDIKIALAASQAEVERLTRERDEALREMGRYAAEAGEAKGRLEMSEAAGIVEGWRERAEAAEARASRAEALVKEAGDVVRSGLSVLLDFADDEARTAENSHAQYDTGKKVWNGSVWRRADPDRYARNVRARKALNLARTFLGKLKGEG